MTASLLAPECPKCGQRAPVVLRGLDSRCAACGASRSLLSGPNVAFAGQPSRVGGLAVALAGAAVLVLGLAVSLGVWLLLQSLLPGRAFGLALAIPMGVASTLFGALLLLGGTRLRKRGNLRQAEVRRQAVKAMVQHRRGPLSAADVAGALELPEAEADELLTRLAREQTSAVTLDVDARGQVVFDFEGEERRWQELEAAAQATENSVVPERLKR